ncbi:MAG: EF-P lysine aminoacylase GenX, partial [Pirellulaceae bacterium]|nr:EF-P lysine aminoacylase GenX [Pirellulaceae bacterium]
MNQDDWRSIATPQALQRRAEIVWHIRSFFHQHRFDEVHTPTISRDTVVDRYIDPIEIAGAALACAGASAPRYYLQTSPEFCMKRLLASGMQAIYQLGPAYRAGERGQFHNPEFTMLEWYRVGESLTEALDFLKALVDGVLAKYSSTAYGPTVTMTYTAAFQEMLGLDPLACRDEELPRMAEHEKLSLGSSWDQQSRDDWLNLLFAECVQPRLGHGRPVIVTHYPASQAALAAVCPDDPRASERYELFVGGVELANGYHELLDAEQLAIRSGEVLRQRRSDGTPDLMVDNRLLAAMHAGMPDSCGCALGVDRLV